MFVICSITNQPRRLQHFVAPDAEGRSSASGFPILTFAPPGCASVIDVWSQPSAPINPTTEFAANYRVIAMDQRNAGGQSRAPITAQDGWDTYTDDHLAVLDHLRIDRCHLYGQCIGGSFIINMLKRAARAGRGGGAGAADRPRRADGPAAPPTSTAGPRR